jgi:hypothetical protein
MFYDTVKIEILYDVPDNYSNVMEHFVMEIYIDYGCNLLNERRGDVFYTNKSIENQQEWGKKYRQENKESIRQYY